MADLRASDAQREQAATALREHFAAGRLTHEELDERVQRAYAARTERELQVLLADLPALPVTRAQSRAELVARRADLRRQLIQQTGVLNTPFVICTVIWLASGASGFFWPVFLLIGTIVSLANGLWELYGPGADLERVQQRLERRDYRRARRQHRRG